MCLSSCCSSPFAVPSIPSVTATPAVSSLSISTTFLTVLLRLHRYICTPTLWDLKHYAVDPASPKKCFTVRDTRRPRISKRCHFTWLQDTKQKLYLICSGLPEGPGIRQDSIRVQRRLHLGVSLMTIQFISINTIYRDLTEKLGRFYCRL